jgi:hypothetical protein
MLRSVPVRAFLVVLLLFGGLLPYAQAAGVVDCNVADTRSSSLSGMPDSDNSICTLPGSGACQVSVIVPGDLMLDTTWPDVIPAIAYRSGYHSPDPASRYRPPISALI